MTLVWAESSHHRPRSGSAWQKFEEACNKIHSGFNFLPFPAGHKCVNRERAAGPTCRDGCARPVCNAHSRTFSHCSARAAPPAVPCYFWILLQATELCLERWELWKMFDSWQIHTMQLPHKSRRDTFNSFIFLKGNDQKQGLKYL